MIGRIAVATATCAALALGVPAARAGVIRSGCQFAATDATGARRFTGLASGYALLDDQSTRRLRCYITVDGVEQTSATGGGTGAAAAVGVIQYTAPKGAHVALCEEIDGATVGCAPATEISLTLAEGSLVRTVCDALADHGVPACAVPAGLPTPTAVQYATL